MRRLAIAKICLFSLVAFSAHAFGQYALGNAVKVATGRYHSCALLKSGYVECWGDNAYGQLGDRTTISRSLAAAVEGISNAIDISAGGDHTCALTSAGEVKCWGNNDVGQSGRDPASVSYVRIPQLVVPSDAIAITSGYKHNCALYSSQQAKCWGDDSEYQLADNSGSNNQYIPVAMRLAYTFTVISAGYHNTCGIRTGDGSIVCWGGGFLGDGRSRRYPSDPVNVQFETTKTPVVGAVALSVSLDNSCATLLNGELWCWGNNSNGEVGDGTITPRLRAVLSGSFKTAVTAVTAGAAHTCAIQQFHTTSCWGANYYGQLGINSTAGDFPTPQALPLEFDFTDISASKEQHTCAVLRNGGYVFCWGYNGYGQLGDNSTVSWPRPVNVFDHDRIFIDDFENRASGL